MPVSCGARRVSEGYWLNPSLTRRAPQHGAIYCPGLVPLTALPSTSSASINSLTSLSAASDPETASIHSAQLQGAADGLMDAIGLNPWTRANPLAQMARQQIRSRVDEQSYEAAWNEGRALSLEQAIDLAYKLGEDVVS